MLGDISAEELLIFVYGRIEYDFHGAIRQHIVNLVLSHRAPEPGKTLAEDHDL